MTDAPPADRRPDDPEPPLPGRVVIDVSNVCRATEIPVSGRADAYHASARLRRVVEQWRRDHGDAADLRFVADHSLRDYFARERAQDEWRTMMGEFDIEGQRVADSHILDYAVTERRFVISNDRFRDFRRRLTWIVHQPDRFRWLKVTGGSLRFPRSGIRPEPDYVITGAEEKSEQRELGYGRDARQQRRLVWLATRWRCRSGRCRTADSAYRQQSLVPRGDRGDQPRCPDCGGRLDNLGPRAAWREIKVMNADRTVEWGRFVLEAGRPVEVGRGREDHGISLDTIVTDPAAQGRVSRKHLLLAVDADRTLSVVDQMSSNGTVVHDSAKQSTALAPHDWRAVRERGWILLGGAVCLTASAREYLSSAAQPPASSTDDRVTQL